MLRLLTVFGLFLLAIVIVLTFVPGMAGMVPGAAGVRDLAATTGVIIGVALLFAWAPSEKQRSK